MSGGERVEWVRRWVLASALGVLGGVLGGDPPAAHAAPRTASRVADHAARAALPDSDFLEQYSATLGFRLGQPSNVNVTPNGEAVLFLRSGARSFVNDLWEFDVATRRERVLLTAEQVLRGANERLPHEERARRERQRVATRGIVAYSLSEDGRRILVPLAGRLFVVERTTGTARELSGGPGFPIDPQISPDGSSVACVRNDDLYVYDVDSGRMRRLTEGANDTLSHGVSEFVAQEEMDRPHGYWWSPDGRHIAYQETRTGGVELLHTLDPMHPERDADVSRYPRAGTTNADVRLGIIAVDGGPTTWVRWDRERYPYLAAVTWSRNAPLTLLIQNRRQTDEILLAASERDGSTRPLLSEHDAAWLNLDDKMPVWREDGRAFLWSTERRGSWQLELHARDGRWLKTLTPPGFGYRKLLHWDEARQQAWVVGGTEPTEAHVFRVPLDPAAGAIERVTQEPGVYAAVFAKHHGAWVRTFDRLDGAPIRTVMDATGAPIGELRSVAEKPRIALHVELTTVGPRQYRAAILHPADFQPGRRYPVILSVYGGPYFVVVTRSRAAYLLDQWLANRGFVVVNLDGRGTPYRGRDWERAIKGNLIDIPLADQVEGLRVLGATHPEMDLTRVGVYGWSFGGYFSAMAVMRRPDVFQAGVAGAPVAEWRDYDTYYTERYMDLPELNRRGYEAASILTYVDRLERPLLIIHGTDDDNVYFTHSLKLCDALFRAGKHFEFLPLPGFTHMVPEPNVRRRLEGRIATFFEEHLTPGPGARAASAIAPP